MFLSFENSPLAVRVSRVDPVTVRAAARDSRPPHQDRLTTGTYRGGGGRPPGAERSVASPGGCGGLAGAVSVSRFLVRYTEADSLAQST